mgnify:FL=1
MSGLPRGLHESIITDRLATQIGRERQSQVKITAQALTDADAPERLASHVESVVRRAISDFNLEGRAALGTRLVREVVDLVQRYAGAQISSGFASVETGIGDAPVEPPRLLREV